MKRAVLAAALIVASSTCSAHKASDAYLTLTPRGAEVEQRLDIALRDLDRDLDLDENADGQLSWGEVHRRWPDIERLAASAVRIEAAGRACTAVAAAPAQLDSHSDGRYAVLQSTLHCAANPASSLQIDYRLFARTDPTHRGIARIDDGTVRTTTQVLIPGEKTEVVHVDPATPASPGADRALPPDAEVQRFLGFVKEGIHHIAIGWDHILFLVTLMLVAVWRRDGRRWVPRVSAGSAWREALRLVTAFTVSHSITLGLAASGVMSPPTQWVESLIAASVLLAALDNLWPIFGGPRWAVVAAFGLVHGFGFAGPLQDLGLARGDLAVPLLGFNLGVELGQMALVALLLPAACAVRRMPFYRVTVVGGSSAAIAMLSGLWLVERSMNVSLLP